MAKIPHSKSQSGNLWRLLTLAIVLFFLGAGIYFMLAPMRESKNMEQALIDQYGWANEYTPPGDGSLMPERLERFIRVRQAVRPECIEYQTILDAIIELDNSAADEDMPGGKKLVRGFGNMINVISAPATLLDFLEARNAALLAEEMGLGEYLYMYLAAYGKQLAGDSASRFSNMKEAYIDPRARNEFIQILGNHLAALEASDPAVDHEELKADLRTEIEELEDGSHLSPWPDGPPGPAQESLASYREQLEDLYCVGIVQIELTQKNRGLSFE